ncbi:MAG: DUF3127 domain-containing protein [Muribaculaceae bacterium]|nr:DUF3127 domain-containing protein [Muribaculaceae bacterium]
MEIEGRIIMDLPLQQGTSKAGNPWRKKEWVLETFGPYPKKIVFYAFGDRIETLQIEPGRDYTVSVDIESREFNGKWYTDVRAFAARPYSPPTPGSESAPYPSAAPAYAPQPAAAPSSFGPQLPNGGMNPDPQFTGGAATEDLPF